MTKKEYCQSGESIAYYSGLDGIEIRAIEYGIEDYIYCISGCFNSSGVRRYHRCKIYYSASEKVSAFFRLYGQRIALDECFRV